MKCCRRETFLVNLSECSHGPAITNAQKIEIVRMFPNTKAAEEARELLKKFKG